MAQIYNLYTILLRDTVAFPYSSLQLLMIIAIIICVKFCTLGAGRSVDPPTPYSKSDYHKPDRAKTAASKLRPVRYRLLYPMLHRVLPCSMLFTERTAITMIKISPSILSADFANLARDIGRIDTADYVHVDVMDGLFVPNISIGIPVVKSIRPTTSLPLDVHLMIDRPVRYVEQFCDAGADIVTCHVEADTEENIHEALRKIHAKGKKAGVVVKPKTPASAVLPFIDEVEMILVMTVEPGFGGQEFMHYCAQKIPTIRQNGKENLIIQTQNTVLLIV